MLFYLPQQPWPNPPARGPWAVPPNAPPPRPGMPPPGVAPPPGSMPPRPRSWASAVNPQVAGRPARPALPFQQLPPLGHIVRPPRPDLPLILITRNGPVPLPTNLTPEQVAAAQASARGPPSYPRPPFPQQAPPGLPPGQGFPPRGHPTAILARPQGPGRPPAQQQARPAARPSGGPQARPRPPDQRPSYRGGSMMSPRDVHYVVQQQLRPLQTQNPYR
eukprot:scaffold6180_cov200-Pinguiococcus_pyrenoidosus.AAC.11